jgi:hypothetical protein
MYLPRNRSVEVAALAILFCLACLIPKQGVAQDVQPKKADRVSGVVVNSVNHEPVARALVVSNDERFAVWTDVNGRFEFVFPETATGNDAAAGPGRSGMNLVGYRPYAFTARKPGFLGRQNDQGVILSNVPDGKEIEIALVPEALIVGHIALPTSEPPDPIEIELYQRQVQKGRAHWVSVGVQATRSDGEFRFAELAAGTYKLLTHELLDEDPKTAAPGGQVYAYAPVYYPNANGFASAGTIQLTPGKIVHANLSLVRQPYFPVIVPVANVPPGVGLNVKVSAQGRVGPGYELGYDPQKQMIVGSLPNGNFRLEATAFGGKVLSGVTNITVRGGAEGMVLPLAASPPIMVNVKEQFTAEVTPGTTTTRGAGGRATSQQRKYDITVIFEPADDFGAQQQSASRGRSETQPDSVQMDNVAPGRYWVQVYPTHGYVASVTASGVDLRRQPLIVPAGSSVPSIEVTLRDESATIEGTVEGVSGLTGSAAPLSQGPYGWAGPPSSASSARVYFIPLPDSTGRFTENFVNQDGKFGAVSLPPGEYRVLAFSNVQPDLEYENPEAMRAYDGKAQAVRLAAGQKERVQLQLVSTSE